MDIIIKIKLLMEVEIMLRGIIVISGNLCGLFNLKKKKQKKKYKKKKRKRKGEKKSKEKKKKKMPPNGFQHCI